MVATAQNSIHHAIQSPMMNSRLETRTLADVMGAAGLFVGFGEDIWSVASVRRVLWLQRHAYQILPANINVAMVFRSDPNQLYGFQMSIPRPISFPMLADTEGTFFATYAIDDKGGFLMLLPDGTVTRTWRNPSVMPRVSDIVRAA